MITVNIATPRTYKTGKVIQLCTFLFEFAKSLIPKICGSFPYQLLLSLSRAKILSLDGLSIIANILFNFILSLHQYNCVHFQRMIY